MLSVVTAGLQTLVVDSGRVGYAHLGVPRSGALDHLSLARANELVGNPPDAAGLECLLRGPVLEAPGRHLVAVAPGETLNGDGSLDLRKLPELRVWVAVEGGLETPVVMGSQTADLLGGIGPGPLRDGDVLPLGPVPQTGRQIRALRSFGNDNNRSYGSYAALTAIVDGQRETPTATVTLLAGPDQVGVEPGPWTVQPNSDRTALRLAGPADPHALPGRTRGLVPGAVQVPPDGNPVVFLAGHPATGGYPVGGFVKSADLARLAQLRPGETLEFTLPRPPRRRRR